MSLVESSDIDKAVFVCAAGEAFVSENSEGVPLS